jgi:hypothetical protein
MKHMRYIIVEQKREFVYMAVAIVIFIALQQTVFATGAARDYDEAYEDVPGAPECWYDGYEDGQNNGFNQDRNEECGSDKGDQYYRAFIHGCKSVEGNTEDICEAFTDE